MGVVAYFATPAFVSVYVDKVQILVAVPEVGSRDRCLIVDQFAVVAFKAQGEAFFASRRIGANWHGLQQ